MENKIKNKMDFGTSSLLHRMLAPAFLKGGRFLFLNDSSFSSSDHAKNHFLFEKLQKELEQIEYTEDFEQLQWRQTFDILLIPQAKLSQLYQISKYFPGLIIALDDDNSLPALAGFYDLKMSSQPFLAELKTFPNFLSQHSFSYKNYLKHIHKRSALFLDRDGVINEDRVYIKGIDQIFMIPEAYPFLREAKEKSYFIGLVTNQSGIGRAYYSWEDYNKVTDYLMSQLRMNQASVDQIIAASFHTEAESWVGLEDPQYRKPRSGMLVKMANQNHLDLESSLIVGDKASDLMAGIMAHVKKAYLIRSSEEQWEQLIKWKEDVEKHQVIQTEIKKIQSLSEVEL